MRNIKNVTIGLFLLFAFFGAIETLVDTLWRYRYYRELYFTKLSWEGINTIFYVGILDGIVGDKK